MSEKWHPYDQKVSGREQGLKDHYYYLVTHKGYETPMKGMWHEEGLWIVLGAYNGRGYSAQYVWDWHEDQPVIAWMELPDVYRP